MFGGAGAMGAMGMGMAMGGEMTAVDYMLLDNAVKHIVGPNATPSPSMILLAQQQGGPPTSFSRMMPYITLMQDIARKNGITPPGVTGKATEAQINNYVMQRAMNWIQQRYAFEAMADSPALTATMLGQRQASAPQANTANQDTKKKGNSPADLLNMMVMSRAMGIDNMLQI